MCICSHCICTFDTDLLSVYTVFKVTSLNILSTMLSKNLLYVIFILTVIFILI